MQEQGDLRSTVDVVYLDIFQPESLVNVICCQHPALGVPRELLCLLRGKYRLYTVKIYAGIVRAEQTAEPWVYLYNFPQPVLHVW